MPALKKLRGFTLIELMIAISIIAIISAVGLVTYNQSQKLGRDAKRKQDLRSIATALELYYQRNSHFPCANHSRSTSANWLNNSDSITGCNIGSARVFDTNYINKLPVDPLSNSATLFGTATGNYGYEYWANVVGTNCTVAGQYYYLATLLENSQDPERVGTADPTFYCTGVKFGAGGSNWNPSIFIIQSQ